MYGRLTFVLVLLWASWPAERSMAQDAGLQLETGSAAEVSVISTPPGYVSPRDGSALEEAERRSRVVRNALIGTSVGFAVGTILVGVGASQCEDVGSRNSSDEWLCNTAGDVLLGIGGTFVGLGAIGMITTGIMLGVRNKQKREIERDLRNRHGSRLRWDVSSSRFVF